MRTTFSAIHCCICLSRSLKRKNRKQVILPMANCQLDTNQLRKKSVWVFGLFVMRMFALRVLFLVLPTNLYDTIRYMGHIYICICTQLLSLVYIYYLHTYAHTYIYIHMPPPTYTLTHRPPKKNTHLIISIMLS